MLDADLVVEARRALESPISSIPALSTSSVDRWRVGSGFEDDDAASGGDVEISIVMRGSTILRIGLIVRRPRAALSGSPPFRFLSADKVV